MTRKRRYLICDAAFAACVCIALGVLGVLAIPYPGVTKANFDRIEKGMTRMEVEEIFGGPAKLQTTSGFWGVNTIEDFWNEGSYYVYVHFNNELVANKKWEDHRLPSRFPDKLRRWLRLP